MWFIEKTVVTPAMIGLFTFVVSRLVTPNDEWHIYLSSHGQYSCDSERDPGRYCVLVDPEGDPGQHDDEN